MNDPIASVLMGQTRVYRLDGSGRLQGVDGFEAVLERVRESFSPEVVQALAPMLDANLLEAAEKAEWKRRYQSYLGVTVSVGDAWDANAQLTLPTGERLEHAVRTTFAASNGCGAARCIEIRTVTAAEAEPGAPKIHYEERRLLEPDTMRVHRETLDQSIEMMLQVPGRPDAVARHTLSRVFVYESP